MLESAQTIYDGFCFRSRLEARWAVFFNTLKIPYEYEKERYVINGRSYLPDFYLPQQKVWVEIKGEEPDRDLLSYLGAFARGADANILVFYGQIELPNPRHYPVAQPAYCVQPENCGADWPFHFFENLENGKIEVAFDGSAEKFPGAATTKKLHFAYLQARMARFEYGFCGRAIDPPI